ncbi:hypothetical protein [Paenibacillus arenilitoris]|uniref:Uncharacterized protein n=1 Tax=Paenibacillus arenilitoris TaxID=2772299 RepID=A0A927CNM5_9BACL|nr:hypothetical protein [Paenibacillus arenilitoris]MBD2870879.1 hypothetical protein [Paenibacillus arenilitoris]
MNLKRSIQVRTPETGGIWNIKHVSAAPTKTIVAINKQAVKLAVTAKLPNLAKDTVLFVETKRASGLDSLKKNQRLKELNKSWHEINRT